METNHEPAADADSASELSFQIRDYGEVRAFILPYRTGGIAVEVVDKNGESLTTLSTNLPARQHLLETGEFFAKTWSENEDIAQDALTSGVFRNTGRTSEDALNAPIWRIR